MFVRLCQGPNLLGLSYFGYIAMYTKSDTRRLQSKPDKKGLSNLIHQYGNINM